MEHLESLRVLPWMALTDADEYQAVPSLIKMMAPPQSCHFH